jgi:hypothetical protein
MIRKARAVWRGTGRTGNGDLSSDSGVRPISRVLKAEIKLDAKLV